MKVPCSLIRWGAAFAASALSAVFAQPTTPTPEMVEQMRGMESSSRRFEPRGAGEPMVVNPATRAESRAFYRAVFFSGVSEPIQWTGAISGTPGTSATGTPGTTAAAFKDAVRTRINWYRAMAGLPAAITFNDTYSAKSQQAALMMSANNTLSHTPSASWLLYTAEGSEAAGRSNLSLGSCGVDAIDGYMVDPYSNNTAAGHRRWILYPQTQVMGTGDVPRSGSFAPANSTWVFDSHYGFARPSVRDSYVAWPTKGYVPYTIIPARWSFSYPNADFSSASVSVTKNGVAVSAVKEAIAGNVGENTLVWIVDGLDTDSLEPHAKPTADTTYAVTISGISGAPQSSYTYQVIVYDPDVSGPGEVSPVISGSQQPTVGAAASYTVTLPSFATTYSWRTVLLAAGPSMWGAEAGTSPDLVGATTGTYATADSSLPASGLASYHLCHPTPDAQTLTVPGFYQVNSSGSPTLSFASRLGWASTTESAHVQISLDEGASWADLYTQSGTSGAGENTFTTRPISLSPYAGRVVRFRFLYSHDGGNYFPQTDASVGWRIDNVTLSGVSTATTGVTQSVSAGTAFTFTPTGATQVGLQACPVLFQQYAMEWGPVFLLSPVVAVGPTISTQPTNDSTPIGSGATFSVVASGAGTVSYQWQLSTDGGGTWTDVIDGGAYAGAGTSTLALSAVSGAMNGYRYRCEVTDSTGTRVSGIAILSVGWSHFAALSARAPAGTGEQTLILGFIFAGGGKPTLMSGVGPWLSTAGVPGALADPQLRLYAADGTELASNDDWGGTSGLTTAFAKVTDRKLDPASKDAALYESLTAQLYTAHVTGVNGTTGVALAEAYDADFTDKTKRLKALSVRNQVGLNADILIAGFVIAGEGNVPKRVIVRGVGPGLPEGIKDRLRDPYLKVHKLNTTTRQMDLVAENDDWDHTEETAALFASVGLEDPLASDSKDAALVLTLEPGVYTAQVSGVGSTTGVALVEIYEAP